MAEYYPLLAKAIGSLPNSTPETRRVVYERARKALIGQLRTLHPPVPDEDIERESVELDRAVERLESELAKAPPAAPPVVATPPQVDGRPAPPPLAPPKPASVLPPTVLPVQSGDLAPSARRPIAPPRPRAPKIAPDVAGGETARLAPTEPPPAGEPDPARPTGEASVSTAASVPGVSETGVSEPGGAAEEIGLKDNGKPRLDAQRPIAPQPPAARGPKRRMWIIPAGVGVVVLLVAGAAWKLRDRPTTLARTKPAEQTQADSGKIAERVGAAGAPTAAETKPTPAPTDQPAKPDQQTPATTPAPDQQAAQQAPAAGNPEVPVAHRAALLIEAPEETNKVKTFLGTAVWKLNNVSEGGPSDAVGLAVEADIDLPDDKMKVVVTFEKNTDASLPASHTIKIRFFVQQGSESGDVKQISVPQMRREDSPSGEPLAGVTVPVVQNSFLVGLSPGNAETANLDLLRGLQWIDVPMLLTSGKIAKLTFEKSDSGQRDLNDAIAAWQKQ